VYYEAVFCSAPGCGKWFKKCDNTTNLQKHYDKFCKGRISQPSSTEEQVVAQTLVPVVPKIKSLKDHFTTFISPDKVDSLNSMLINAIISANLPLSTVDNPEFRYFVRGCLPSYETQMPHRTKATELLDQQFEKAESALHCALRKATDLSFTTDSATTLLLESVEALTCHFICPKWKLHSTVVAVELLQESHTALFLQSVIQDLTQRWELDAKLFVGVSDGAANIMKCLSSMTDDQIIDDHIRFFSCFECALFIAFSSDVLVMPFIVS